VEVTDIDDPLSDGVEIPCVRVLVPDPELPEHEPTQGCQVPIDVVFCKFPYTVAFPGGIGSIETATEVVA
jgi:hypothetical protein